jgi:hypothetical protein
MSIREGAMFVRIERDGAWHNLDIVELTSVEIEEFFDNMDDSKAKDWCIPLTCQLKEQVLVNALESHEEAKGRCVICEGKIPVEHGWKEGHNAQPVRNGRCCGRCNIEVVVPMRMRRMQEFRDMRTVKPE